MARASGFVRGRLLSVIEYPVQSTLYKVLGTEYTPAGFGSRQILMWEARSDNPRIWAMRGRKGAGLPTARPHRIKGKVQCFLRIASGFRDAESFIPSNSRLLLFSLRLGFRRDAFEHLARFFQVVLQSRQGLRGEALDGGVLAVVCFVTEHGDIGFVVSHHIAGVGAVDRGPRKL